MLKRISIQSFSSKLPNINRSCEKVAMEVPVGRILIGLMELVISLMINEEMLARRVSMDYNIPNLLIFKMIFKMYFPIMIIGRPNKLYKLWKNIIMNIGHVVEPSFFKDTNGLVTHVFFKVELHNTFITTFCFKDLRACNFDTMQKFQCIFY